MDRTNSPIVINTYYTVCNQSSISDMVGKYPVITLCGSTRFKEQFFEAQKRLTLEGYIGESTRSEIEYTKKNGKEDKYLESI